MWTQNIDSAKWENQVESLDKEVFDFLRQELDQLRFYSKCLDGTSYLPINNLDNDIYDILQLTNESTWYVDSTVNGSTYAVTYATGSNFLPISKTDIATYSKYTEEYGHTLKNLFTPERTIDDALDSFLKVDVATTEPIDFITAEKPGLILDNITLKEGHRILVKDQVSFVTLDNSVDPTTFFTGNFTILEVDDDNAQTDYSFLNSENGIYTYTNNFLVRTSDLDVYETNVRYSVFIKLGDDNTQKQYHLSRLLSGYYPLVIENDPIEFLENHNYLLRNLVEYTDVLEVDYEDVLYHGTQSDTVPTRTIAVGDFGQITVHQDDIVSILRNEFKDDLKSISQTDTHYWMVGQKGVVLKVEKEFLSIEKIDLGEFLTFNSVHFINNLRGFIVGDLGLMYYTINGGRKWIKISVDAFENFRLNNVLFYDLNTVYVVGHNGVFLRLIFRDGAWGIEKIAISRVESIDDTFIILDDILHIEPLSTTTWGLTYSGATSSVVKDNKEGLILTGINGELIIYDVNNFVPDQDFLFLDVSESATIKQSNFRSDTNIVQYLTETDIKRIDLDTFTIDSVGDNNILSGDDPVVLIGQEYNKSFDLGTGLGSRLVGDRGLFEGIVGGVTFSLDPTFAEKQKSKLLFLDYDMGAKLNWFDQDLNYRLPNDIDIPITATEVSLQSIGTDNSWLDYYKDRTKVFTYNEQLITSNEVLISSTFNTLTGTNSNLVTVTSITKELNDIIELAPTFGATPSSPSAPTNIFDLYLFKNLLILRAINGFTVDTGDVLQIESGVISGNLTVNRVENLTDAGGNRNFLYCYSHFNETIMSNLIASTASITLQNLNKWSTPLDEYDKHPISIGYSGTTASATMSFSANLNNKTAYYNMEAEVLDPSSNLMNYASTFLNFGYTAQYNLLDYLENIDSTLFTSAKVFTSMPQYLGLPEGNDGITISDNRLAFHEDFKFEYDTFYKHTYIDVATFNFPTTANTSQALIIDKYFDPASEKYIIELNKEIETPVSIDTVNILSRNTLEQISSDLQELNNIHRPERDRVFGSANFTVRERDLNFKFNTDSYAKIILSDLDIKESLTGVIYTDFKNEIALNIIQLDEERTLDIISVTNSVSFAEFTTSIDHELIVGQRVFIDMDGTDTNILPEGNFSDPSQWTHLFTPGWVITGGEAVALDSGTKVILLTTPKSAVIGQTYTITYTITEYTSGSFFLFFGGVATSVESGVGTYVEEIVALGDLSLGLVALGGSHDFKVDNLSIVTDLTFSIYDGLQTVGTINTSTSFTTSELFTSVPGVGSVRIEKFDPFLNYRPSDIIDVGISGEGKLGIEITDKMITNNGRTLENVDLNKARFTLVDELNIQIVKDKYPWLLEAEIRDGFIGEDENGPVWYDGTWICGRWFAGTWYKGMWLDGEFYGGDWHSVDTQVNILRGEPNLKAPDNKFSIWFGGNHHAGTWHSGTWIKGKWITGTWEDGDWFSGTWQTGIHNDGNFFGGTWIDGSWNGGLFSCLKREANWIDGSWSGGDFECGNWFNGIFKQDSDKISRFGTAPTNFRKAIWESGNWFNGEFHSFLNLDDDGNTVASDSNKLSIWKTGVWNNGDFYGGTTFNIDWKRGTWYNGVSERINIIGLDSTTDTITIEGEYLFNLEDEFFVIDNNTGSTFSLLGSNVEGDQVINYLTPEESSFSNPSLWTDAFPPGGWVVVAGQAVALSTVNEFLLPTFQAPPGIYSVIGQTYTITYTITEYNSGSLFVAFGGVALATVSAVGTYVENVVSIDDAQGLLIIALGNHDLKVDNISVTSPGFAFNGPTKYKIKTSTIVDGNTELEVFENIPVFATASVSTNTDIEIVSNFANIEWKNGIFFNGLFDGDWRQGIWYNGVFIAGTWGEEVEES